MKTTLRQTNQIIFSSSHLIFFLSLFISVITHETLLLLIWVYHNSQLQTIQCHNKSTNLWVGYFKKVKGVGNVILVTLYIVQWTHILYWSKLGCYIIIISGPDGGCGWGRRRWCWHREDIVISQSLLINELSTITCFCLYTNVYWVLFYDTL